ncbi:hypothetical protein OAE87_01090 [bacterium]|nr:hypothetical protein [bacterium]
MIQTTINVQITSEEVRSLDRVISFAFDHINAEAEYQIAHNWLQLAYDALPEFQASTESTPASQANPKAEIINLEAFEAAVIGNLPSHFQNAWTALEEEEPNASAWFGEQCADLQADVVRVMQARVIETLCNDAKIKVGIPVAPNATQKEQG